MFAGLFAKRLIYIRINDYLNLNDDNWNIFAQLCFYLDINDINLIFNLDINFDKDIDKI